MPDMFANAQAYEAMMGRWSTRLAPLFATFAGITDDGRVLDVGCGTGSLVRAVAGMTRHAEIVGVDPAQPFIDFARTRFVDSRITFDHGNAMDLPYPAASFAHALSLLVLQFVPQPEKAAHEMRRVTRPGGTVAASTWDRDGLEMSAVFWEEAVRLDPAAEARPERARRLGQTGDLAALWHATGLEQVEETALEIRMDFTSFDDYWKPQLAGVGPLGAYLADVSAEQRDALRHALRKRFQGDKADGAFSLRAKALAVRGVVPKT